MTQPLDQPREFTQVYVAPVGAVMCYTHIWPYDHVLYPYMVIRLPLPVDHAAGDTVNGWTPWMDPGSQDIYYVHDDGRVQWERPAEYARRFGS